MMMATLARVQTGEFCCLCKLPIPDRRKAVKLNGKGDRGLTAKAILSDFVCEKYNRRYDETILQQSSICLCTSCATNIVIIKSLATDLEARRSKLADQLQQYIPSRSGGESQDLSSSSTGSTRLNEPSHQCQSQGRKRNRVSTSHHEASSDKSPAAQYMAVNPEDAATTPEKMEKRQSSHVAVCIFNSVKLCIS